MTDQPDPLVQFSNALATRAELAKSTVVAIRLAHGRHITGMAWGSDIVVASEQSLPRREEFELVAPGGAVVSAKIAGAVRIEVRLRCSRRASRASAEPKMRLDRKSVV